MRQPSSWVILAIVAASMVPAGAASADCPGAFYWIVANRQIVQVSECGWLACSPSPIWDLPADASSMAGSADTTFWVTVENSPLAYHVNRWGELLGSLMPVGFASILTGIAETGDTLWACSADGRVTRFLGNGTVVSNLSLPIAAGATGIAVHPESGRMWISRSDGTILECSTSGAVLGEHHVGAYAPLITDLAFDRVAGLLRATSSSPGGASLIASWTPGFDYQGTAWFGFPGVAGVARPLAGRVSCDGPSGITSAGRAGAEMTFYGVAPNPVRSSTRAYFQIVHAGQVRLSVLDAQGRLITLLLDQRLGAGFYHVPWDGTRDDGARASPGVYFMRFESSFGSATARVELVPGR